VVANVPSDLSKTIKDMQAEGSEDDIKEFMNAYVNMPLNIYSATNAIRTSLATSVFSSRPVDVSPADFSSTLAKFKSAGVNAPEKETLRKVGERRASERQTKATRELQAAQAELASANDAKTAVAARIASATTGAQAGDRSSKVKLAPLGARSTSDVNAQDLDAAGKKVELATARVVQAQAVQAREFAANTRAEESQDTFAVEQVKGLSAALTLCVSL
jgi:hypothetical protein